MELSLSHQPDADGNCVGCLEKLKEAHPEMRAWFLTKVLPWHPQAHVSWSYRGRADQEACVVAKTSKLHFPHSAHNRRIAIDPSKSFDPSNEQDPNSKPESMALDLFEIRNGIGTWDPKFFLDVADEAKSEPIFWGGAWKTLGDKDHFELKPTPYDNDPKVA